MPEAGGRVAVSLSRRELLRRGACLGLPGGGLVALLAACGGGAATPTSAPSTTAGPAATTATAPSVARTVGSSPAPPVGTSATATRTATVGSDAPPIIFVHGNGDSSALWLTTVWRFESQGWPRDRLVALDFPDPNARDDDTVPQPGRSGTDEQRAYLAARVDDVLARTGAPRAVLVGNSRGGYAIRNYLKNGGVAKVGHAILCGTPNHGVSAQLPVNSEFNGAGPFLTALNAGGEVVSGVATMTIRSDRNDKFAQPGIAPGVGYDGPELRGATNVILDGVDHRETAYSARAFAEMHRFLTGRAPAAPAIAPEAAVQLAGRITGYERKVPTNRGMGGVAVTVFATDPATGARVGGALYRGTTDPDGRWGPVTAGPTAPCEFVVAAPGAPTRHFFRSPFPRSSPYVSMRLFEDPAEPGQGLIIFTRPRGYVATGRDQHLLDGRPVPGVKPGVPTDASFKVPFDPPERAVPAALNGEALTVRAIPDAVVYAEFQD